MAVSYVSGTKWTTDGSTTSISMPALNCISGNLLILCIGYYTTSSPSTVISDTASNTWEKIGTYTIGHGTKFIVYAVANCKGNASNVVTVSNFAGANYIHGVLTQYSGWAASMTWGMETNGSFTAATSWTSPSFSPNAGDLVITYTMGYSGPTYTAGSNYTLRTGGTSYNQAYEDRIGAPASSQTASISWSGAMDGDYIVVSFTPIVDVLPVTPTGTARYPLELIRRRIFFSRAHQSFGVVGANSDLVVVPASPVPPLGPTSYRRTAWNPDRSGMFIPQGLPTFDPGLPPPGMPLLPAKQARPPWNPPRGGAFLPGLPSSMLVIVPTLTPRMYGPDSYARRSWNPPRGSIWIDAFPRLPWNPDGRYGQPWEPMLPQRFLRTKWSPGKYGTHSYSPPGINPVYSLDMPAWAWAAKPFTVHLRIGNETSAQNLLILDVHPYFKGNESKTSAYIGPVSIPGYANLPTMMTSLYRASGWLNIPPRATQTFSFDCVINAPGTYSIECLVRTADASNLSELRQTILHPRTITSTAGTIVVRSVTG